MILSFSGGLFRREAFVFRVFFVVMILRGRRLEVVGEFGKDAGENGVDGLLIRSVSIPYRDQMGVEADGEADAANVVAYTLLGN